MKYQNEKQFEQANLFGKGASNEAYSENVYVVRDGEKIPYSALVKEVETDAGQRTDD